MGSSCAKSYQAQRYAKIDCEKPRLSNQQHSTILIINEYLLASSRGCPIDRQNSIEYRCQFNDSEQEKRFTPRIGFESSQKNSGFRNNQFSFKNFKTDEQDRVFEIDTSAYGSETLWKRVTSTGSHLLINDHIKLGGNILKLKYFLNQDQIRAMKQGNEEIEIKRAGPEDNVCRLCKNHKGAKQEKFSPFILPCKCTGVFQSVHQNCFSREIFDQSITLDDFKIAFRFVVKKTQCQTCHQSLQTYIWKRFLANLVIHEGYYAIFERKVSSDINMVEHTEFFVIRFFLENQQIKLGRSSACHCSIPEEDIQKTHATLKVKNGLLYIFDDGSQTGTFAEHHSNKLVLGEQYFYDRFSFQTKIRNLKVHSSNIRANKRIQNNRIRV